MNILEEGAIGGPQRRSLAVAVELAGRPGAHGANTTLLIPQTADALAAACEEQGVRYSAVPVSTLSRKRRAAFRYVLMFIPETIKIAYCLRRSKVDVVHVSGGAFCFKGAVAAGVARVPYIWHLNDTKSDPLVRRGFKLITRAFKPAHLIYAAHAVESSYAPWVPPKTRSSVVPAPHRPDLSELEREDYADPYPADAKGLRVLMLANINTVKGLDDAMAAAELLTCEATIFIAGGIKSTQQKYFESLQRRVAEKNLPVVFLGHCSDVAPFVAHSDISLCASLAEASPLSVWEAAAAGKAIVSTDVGDVARELPSESAALIVAVGDSAAMARSIDRLAADWDLRKRLGKEARKLMRSATSIAHVGDLSLESYQLAAAE